MVSATSVKAVDFEKICRDFEMHDQAHALTHTQAHTEEISVFVQTAILSMSFAYSCFREVGFLMIT